MADRHDAARRRLKPGPEGKPLSLPHSHVRRLLERRATLLVLTRELKPFDQHEILDAQTVRRNQEHRERGRFDLQSNPHIVTIEITDVAPNQLGKIDLLQARAAGFQTRDDLYEDWRTRRRQLDLAVTVYLCKFTIVDVLYLHKLVHRGYTTDPAHAAEDKAEALAPAELEDMAKANRERYREINADRIARQEARSLVNQLREAQLHAHVRGLDISPEVQAIRHHLEQIRNKLSEAAA